MGIIRKAKWVTIVENATILDYLQWRGDLDFRQSAFNEIDRLILTQIAYIPFEGVLPPKRSMRMITLEHAAQKYFPFHLREKEHLGMLIPKQIFELFRVAAGSKRFGKLLLGSYVNIIDEEAESQFCAMNVLIEENKELFIIFRGTDDTLIGWKEDFNMSFMGTVPAQQEAVWYTDYILKKYQTASFIYHEISFAGHSKGGNLAVYAAAFCKNRGEIPIKCIYNFDGPGFGKEITDRPEYISVREKIHMIVPRECIVGVLLEHEKSYAIVHSKENGLLQHDALTWNVDGASFLLAEQITESSKMWERTMADWLAQTTREETQKFIACIFRMLSLAKVRTLTELCGEKRKNVMAVIRVYLRENSEEKKQIRGVLRSILKIWKENTKKKYKIGNNSTNNVDKSL